MARDPRPGEGEPGLFDLSIEKGSEAGRASPPEQAAGAEERDTLPLFEGVEVPPVVDPVEPAPEKAGTGTPGEPASASPLLRLRAGLLDLGLILAVGVAVRLGLAWLGVEPKLADWPAGLVFLLAFSFLYCVLPLAFWGRTPGMARIGLKARGAEEVHLTFGQTVRRWLGSVITLAGLGLPLLLSLTGASLSDRLSRSRTVVLR